MDWDGSAAVNCWVKAETRARSLRLVQMLGMPRADFRKAEISSRMIVFPCNRVRTLQLVFRRWPRGSGFLCDDHRQIRAVRAPPPWRSAGSELMRGLDAKAQIGTRRRIKIHMNTQSQCADGVEHQQRTTYE